jgi:NAD+ kinase
LIDRYHPVVNSRPKHIYFVANALKPETAPALDRMVAWCEARGIEGIGVSTAPAGEAARHDDALVVALGGDGTVLRAAAMFAESGTPILGINVGSLGFLTQAGLEDWEEALGQVIGGRASIEERMRLAYEAGDIAGTVLNDLVVTGTSDSRFCELELSWGDGVVSAYPGDGLIVATATGSTAYSLSAGGPVIVPPAACILATPHAAHKLGLRPVIFPADEVLRVRACTAVQLFADGDPVLALPAGAAIAIRRSVRPTRLVRLDGAAAFFTVLDAKLNWADPASRRSSE